MSPFTKDSMRNIFTHVNESYFMDELSKSEFKRRLYSVSPQDFEELVAEVWRKTGWTANTTMLSGDAGIDIIATKESPFTQKQLIQAKRYGPNTSVGSPDVQQYASLKQQEENVDSVVVVTSNDFTRNARILANKLNVKLVTGGDIYEILHENGLKDVVNEYFTIEIDIDQNKYKNDNEKKTVEDPATKVTEDTLDPFSPEPLASVSKKWSIQLGELELLKPTIYNDRLYIGSTDQHLSALEIGAGVEEWTANLRSEVTSSPTVRHGTIFIGCKNGIYCLNEQGEGRWSFDTNYPIIMIDEYDGVIYAQNKERSLYALDARNGDQIWRFDAHGSERIYFGGVVATAESVYIVGGEDSTLYSINRSSGDLKWSCEMEGHTHGPLAIDSNSLYLGTLMSGELHSISRDSGNKNWTYNADLGIHSLTVNNKSVYFGSRDHHVYSINRTDGTKEWSMETDAMVRSSLAASDEVVYAGSADEKLHAISSGDGKEIWSFDAGSEVTSASISNDIVYGSTYNGSVFSLEY